MAFSGRDFTESFLACSSGHKNRLRGSNWYKPDGVLGQLDHASITFMRQSQRSFKVADWKPALKVSLALNNPKCMSLNIFISWIQRSEEYRELRNFNRDHFRIWGSCTLIHQNEAYAFGGLQNPTQIALLDESSCGLFLTKFQLPRPGMAFHSCCNLDVSFYELDNVNSTRSMMT